MAPNKVPMPAEALGSHPLAPGPAPVDLVSMPRLGTLNLAMLAAALLLAGCSLSPLRDKIKPGRDAFVVVSGTGSDGITDIFAALPGGGTVWQITFTSMTERSPRLTDRGGLLAFLRYGVGTARGQGELVVLNLLNGAERRIALPEAAESLQTIGWTADEHAIDVATSSGVWRVNAPPAEPDPRRLDLPVGKDSALMVLVGTPRFARVAPCDSGGLCITGPNGVPRELSIDGRLPARWGSDSLAWLEGDRIVIRPLGPGPTRQLDLDPTVVSKLTGVSYASPQP